jgi:hypothetical protein
MGTAILQLRDNKGIMHEFTLTHINYMPKSPVNLLSLWRLAEHYCNSNGIPDQDSTGINSSYNSHTLYWNKKEFSKTFCTADSGLPVCLFFSGYSHLSASTSHLSKYYNNTINWAFSLQVKGMELAYSDDGDVVVMLDSEGGISFDMPISIDNVISFMKGIKLQYNNDNGIQDIVTFLGMDYVDDIQMVCHIQWLDRSKLLAVPQILNFIEIPDIASIPQTNKEYYDECHYLDPSDLEQIARPQALSPLQEEIMSHCCHLHHTPRLIVMAELGEIPKRLAQL